MYAVSTCGTDIALVQRRVIVHPNLRSRDEAETNRTSSDLVHHSDRGVQYVSICYTERLSEAGIEPSVGSVGDSYDNALADRRCATS